MGHDRPRYDDRFDHLAVLAHRVAFRIVGDRRDAEDVAQEALARAYVRWRRVSAYDEAWVTRVAANLAIGVVRRRRATPELAERRTNDHAAATVERAALVAALESLPPRQREVVVLRHLADLPEAEVARQLGCSVGTVKTHAHRGLAALRAALGEPAPAGPGGLTRDDRRGDDRGGDGVRAIR